MSIANSATCDTPRRPAPIAVVAGRPAPGLPTGPEIQACPLPETCRAASSHADPKDGWQVREDDDKYDVPDPRQDEEHESDAELAAYEHTEAQRQAMGLLDDAENLLSVLLDAIEDDGDSRAMQVEAVLKVVRKKLDKAHTRIDRQESDYRRLFRAYFELKTRSEKVAE